MRLGKGLIIGGSILFLLDLTGFILSSLVGHFLILGLSVGMIVWGVREIRSARRKLSMKDTE